jgi:hypothetical protein
MTRGGYRKNAIKPKSADPKLSLTIRVKKSTKARMIKKAGKGKVGRYVEALIVADLGEDVVPTDDRIAQIEAERDALLAEDAERA